MTPPNFRLILPLRQGSVMRPLRLPVATRLVAAWLVGLASIVAMAGPGPRAQGIETSAKHAFLLDAATGAVLFEKNADLPMPPASMGKMMTVYLLFERLKDGRLSLDDTFAVSENAWRKGGSRSGGSTMFLQPRTRVRIEDLVRGMIVQSGNDACIVVAEGLASSEAAFAEIMTRRGRELGLRNSVFRNASGLPDPEQVTTARDLATLALRTIHDFPEFYRYYSETSFTYNGVRQGNRNPMLYRDSGVDGLKTGHIEESGYGLAASAKRGDRRLILVVNGLASVRARSAESERLLEWGMREFNNYALFKAGERVADAEVWLGHAKTVPLVIRSDVLVTLPRKARRDMKVVVVYDGPVPAPIAPGAQLGRVVVTAPGFERKEVALFAEDGVERLGLFGRLGTAFKSILWGTSG